MLLNIFNEIIILLLSIWYYIVTSVHILLVKFKSQRTRQYLSQLKSLYHIFKKIFISLSTLIRFDEWDNNDGKCVI